MAKTKKETTEAVAVNQEAVEKVEKKETEDVVTTDAVEKADNEVTEDIAEPDTQDAEENEETTPPSADDTVKEEYVDYTLQFLPGKEMGDYQTVTVNGKNYQVAYGVPVKVPVGVKEILDDMIRSQRLLKNKIDRLTEKDRCIAKLED